LRGWAAKIRAGTATDPQGTAVSNRIRSLSLALSLSLGVLALVLVASSLGASAATSGFGSALVGSAPVGNGPSELADDPATHTIYVANGYNDNGPQHANGDTVSVIDSRHCNARDVSRCKGPWPTIKVGRLPGGIAVDEQTDTVYVASIGGDSVSVFDGATCNASDTSGCSQTPASVPVGSEPLGVYADPTNHTVYVTNTGAPSTGGGPANNVTVSMINSATCTATDLSACPTTPPPTVTVSGDAVAVTVDQGTASVYVTTFGKGRQNGFSVFNAATCNATVQTGCGSIGHLGDPNANDGEVDEADQTLYTANYNNTISAYDLSRCDAADLAGCATDKPGIVTPWPDPVIQENDLYAVVDPPLHSVYVTFAKDAALVVVNTKVCNGTHLAACARLRPESIHTGAEPEGLILDPTTQTLYTANEVDNDISVINAAACSAEDTQGCRHPAPSVGIPSVAPLFAALDGTALATDDAVHTAYVGSGTDELAMINTRRCNADQTAGCAHPPPTAKVGKDFADVATNPKTGTIYVAGSGPHSSGEISVISAGRCNATRTTGCSHLKTLRLSDGLPDELAVNPVTDTIYATVATAHGHDIVNLFNGASCDAATSTGCDQKPGVLKLGKSGGGVGRSSLYLAVNPKTNTLYATNKLWNGPNAHTVDVLDGATCDAADHAGCGQKPATVTVGDDPREPAVDPATDTIYIPNQADGDYAATVSAINGATCDAEQHSGCHQRPPAVPVGFAAFVLTVDPSNDRVYSANLSDTSVSVIDGATCNSRHQRGCRRSPVRDAVGNYPYALAADPGAGTVYVANLDNTVSVLPLGR
jgi:DNA-binding beta-propeller fold protein YncE